ncbi:hypothetical protein [Arthrobacter sp. SX1312]|uniref:hypothetical protein n=1 Tax=Arthrobacter sp. SX1312 TaxID=2058896 RepID=UPI000CE4F812|nr:hypothetical protein [Arthrobacter sp. SX1312]
MATRSRTHQHNSRRRSAPGRGLGAVVIAAGLIATTSCTPTPEPEPVSDPVKLLQHVRVGLSPAAGIETIEGTTISVSATGASSTENTEYSTADTVGELPVRVSLQYRAGGKSGSDLAELQGHTGPVEIDLTLENLTVEPRTIEYDAAGQTRSATALVGAPLTIAASTKLEGVRTDDVTPGSADGTAGTNGVLSSTEDGAAVVQWATVLAPPRSGASTTLRLVADVEDFQVPAFDLAVQPGLNTDLSADGVITDAFSSGTGSELDLQRRTIALVADVNIVLTKAGATITDVRQNLETTSETLGVETAGELRDNSQALARTMQDLKDQLQSLGSDLEAATSTAQSTTLSQLQQTVSAVDSMLGDTSAAPTTVPVNGDGCTAEVPRPGQTATVYSSILTMAAQLDAYAKVSADCRDMVADSLRTTVGPENPTPEECAAQGSVTCSLRGSAVTVTAALVGLVAKSDALVASLDLTSLPRALKNQEASEGSLAEVSEVLEALLETTAADDDYTAALATVEDAIESARDSVTATRDASAAARDSIDELRDRLEVIGGTATAARSELADGSLLDGSMMQQSQRLADELCRLADGKFPRNGRLSTRDAEQLRSYLTSTPCEPTEQTEPTPSPEPPAPTPTGSAPGTPTPEPTDSTPSNPTPAPTDSAPTVPAPPVPTPDGSATDDPAPGVSATDGASAGATMDRVMQVELLPPLDGIPPLGFDDPLDVRLRDQATAWDSVLAAVDTTDPDQEIAQAFDALDTTIDDTEAGLDAVEDAVEALDETATADVTSIERELEDLKDLLGTAIVSSERIGATLTELKAQQDGLGAEITKSLGKVSADTKAEIDKTVGNQVREVAEIGDAGSASVITAFDRSISGLKVTSDEVVTDAGGTVDKQRIDLNQRGAALAASLDESTQASLANIASSTSGSTRDVEGAGALLASSLNNVMLDLGDRSVNGSGLLGSMATSAAKADTADFQLALASQNAEGYTNIRSRDVAGLLLRQAQFKASLAAVEELPPFHLKVPEGATSQTLYTLTIDAGA